MSSSKTPCAACKTLRRKCRSECVFAPYFPPDQPQKFETVHRVYGASNVAKILSDLPPTERAEAVTSLVYEAEARLKNPIYGCVGSVSILQHRLKQIQAQLQSARQELATYIGPSAMNAVLNPGFIMPQFTTVASNMEQMSAHDYQQQQQIQHQLQSMGLSNRRFDGAGPSGQHNQQIYNEGHQQQLVEEHDMLRNLEHQIHHRHQQQPMDLMMSNRRFDGAGPSGGSYDGNVRLIQQQQVQQNQTSQLQPHAQEEQHEHLQQLLQHQLLLQQKNHPPQPNHGDGSGVDPTC